MGRGKITIPKNELVKLYIKGNQSPYSIAKLYGCSFSTITNRIREYGIPFKSHSVARIKYKKQRFRGRDEEKAYMIGFRLGDLNVYSKSQHSEVIVVRTHTTKLDQVNVMKRLFAKYGRVTISRSRHRSFHINCFLDSSFSFLLPKEDVVREWIKKRSTFSAFVAGYTDAEGSFGINQGKARFKIDSYDYGILLRIHTWLLDRGIPNKFWCIGRAGEMRPEGYRWNKDIWRLTINRAEAIKKFCSFIENFLLHKKRIGDMKICLRNIKIRAKKRDSRHLIKYGTRT